MEIELKEEFGINALNRRAKSQIIKGLESQEAIVLIYLAGASIFFGIILLMFKVTAGLWLQLVTLPALYILIKILRYFHKKERSGYIVSLLCYLTSQPKKIYVRKGSRLFEKQEQS